MDEEEVDVIWRHPGSEGERSIMVCSQDAPKPNLASELSTPRSVLSYPWLLLMHFVAASPHLISKGSLTRLANATH